MKRNITIVMLIIIFCGIILASLNSNTATNNDIVTPKIGDSFQWDLSESPLDTTIKADIYDIDYFETSSKTIEQLHEKGIQVICYINVGAWEDYRDDAGVFPQEVLGNDYKGWEGEKWLDISNYQLFAEILEKRFDLAKSKGCDGIEPDNIQGYQENTGFNLSYADQLEFNKWIAELAHDRNMSIGLKNNPDQVSDLLEYYDWALLEDCHVWDFCDEFTQFIEASKPVFQVEYTDNDITLDDFCQDAKKRKFTAILKHRDLDSWIQQCP